MSEFLDRRLPAGGTFRTVLEEKNLDSTEDLQAFVECLQQPFFKGHICQANDLGLDRAQLLIVNMETNLCVLQFCTKKCGPGGEGG